MKTGRMLSAALLAACVSAAWGQANKPKPVAQPAQEPLQIQKPNAPPVQTQQLPGQAPPPSASAKPAPQAGGAPETFMMPMPKGWKQASVEQNYNVRTVQYVPDGQPADKGEGVLRSLVFAYVKDAPLEEFLGLATRVPKGECQDLVASPVSKGLVNGYESVFVTRFCTKSSRSGQGEVTMFKAIQGKTALYLGERTWRIKPFTKDKPPVPKETYDGWATYMQAVTLCVPEDAVRPCPKVGKQ